MTVDNRNRFFGNNKIFGAVAVCIAAAAWGVDGVLLTPNLLNRSGLPLDAAYVVMVVHAIPFLIMNIIFFRFYKLLKSFSLSDVLYVLGVSLFGGVLGTMCIVKALFLVNFQNLTIIALLQKLQPFFAIMLSVLLLKEKPSKHYYLWALVAMIGGYVMTFGFALPASVGQNVIQASLLALLAAFSFGSSTVFSKKLLIHYPAESITLFRYGLTTAISLVIVIFNDKLSEFGNTPTMSWLLFVIIAFTTGSGAILLYYYGLKHIKASLSTICELCFPISACVIDYFVNDNTMSMIQWLGALLMMIAIFKISFGGD